MHDQRQLLYTSNVGHGHQSGDGNANDQVVAKIHGAGDVESATSV